MLSPDCKHEMSNDPNQLQVSKRLISRDPYCIKQKTIKTKTKKKEKKQQINKKNSKHNKRKQVQDPQI